LSWFTVAGVTVRVLPGQLSAEVSGPPYGPVRDIVGRLVTGLPDVRVGGLRFHRTIHFPVQRSTDWSRMVDVLVGDFRWSRCGGGICAVQVEPDKPSGGSIAITARPSERRLDDGRSGIRIDVRDCYLAGDAEGSAERVLGVLATEFAGAVSAADSIVDGLMLLCASPRGRSMAA